MKLIDIPPNYLNKEFASKICKNKKLMKKYIQKYDLWGGRHAETCIRKTI